MKALVILGAGDGSLPTYLAARRLGHHVIGVDRHDCAVAAPLADEFVHLSTTEAEAIVAALGDRPDIVGVLAPSSDVALPTLQVLARRYGTPALPPRVVRASTNKAFFHRLCTAAGLASYRLVSGSSKPQLIAAAVRLRMPLVVKPTDSTGSRGIRLCTDRATLPEAIETALSVSPTHTAVLEERVAGSHHTLEGFLNDGRLAFAAITTRTLTDPPYLVTTSHRLPSGLPVAVQQRIRNAVEAACESLCFSTGPVDVDVVVEPDGTVQLIEIGARVGGSGLTELVRLAEGVDLVEASINAAVGQPVDLEPQHAPRHGLLTILGSDRDGTLTTIHGENDARAIPGLSMLQLVTAPGRKVEAYRHAGAKLGYATLAADGAPALAEAGAALRSRLTFDITEPDITEPDITGFGTTISVARSREGLE